MSDATKWGAAGAALAHVLHFERSRGLAERRLRQALADSKLHARGIVIYPYGPNRGAELLEEPLSPDLWWADPEQQIYPAKIDWLDNSAIMRAGVHPDCNVYKIEINWPELLAIWPTAAKSARRLRQLTLVSVAKQASRAGLVVARYEVNPDGKITIVAGEPSSAATNDFDKWKAKHGAH